MNCPNCGQPADGRFCRNCGANLEQPQQWGQRFQQMTPVQQTISSDLATLAMLVGSTIGFFGGGALWLWALYDESVVEQSMIWFLGALPAAIAGAFAVKWAIVALWTR